MPRSGPEAEPSAGAARDAFLLKLSDLLRPLSDPLDIQEAVVRELGQHLETDRAFYAEVSRDARGQETAHMERVYCSPGTWANIGRFPLDDFGDMANDLRAGRTLVVDDIAAQDETTEVERKAVEGVEIRAFIALPLIKDGRLIAILVVHQKGPRAWTPEDVALLDTVARRNWAAVEQSPAERAMHRAEARHRQLFESMDEGFCLLHMIVDERDAPLDYRVVEINPAFATQTGLRGALGRTLRELAPDMESAWFETYDRVALTGESTRFTRYNESLDRWFEAYAFRMGEPEERLVGVLFRDITRQKQAEASLRLSEARQAFLLELGDALRPLQDPVAIIAEACRRFGEHLSAAQVGFAEVDEAQDHVTIDHAWSDGRVVSAIGTWRMADFGPGFVAEMKAGATATISDIRRDPRTEDPAVVAAYARLRISATLHVPLVKQGRLMAMLFVHHPDPHAWTPAETGLAEEVADRLWAAVERAYADTDMRASEERYRTLFESMDEGFCIVEMIRDETGHAVDYRFLETNPAFERQAGFPGSVGRRMLELVPDHDAHWFELYGRVADTGEAVRFEEGSASLEKWWDVHAFRLGEPGQDRVAILFNDITARRRAELALREFNTTLEARVTERTEERDRVWRLSRDLFVVVGADGIMRAANPASTTILGYEPEEFVGRSFRDFIWPDDAETTQASLEEAVASRDLVGFENRFRHKDGTPRWISWHTSVESDLVYAYGRDVTAEKERQAQLEAAEAARREADALYRAYFQNSNEGLFVIAVLPDGGFSIEEVNPAHQAAVGSDMDAIRGKRIEDQLPPEAAEAVSRNYRRAVESGGPLRYRESAELGGRVLHFETVLVPVRDETGQITRIVGSGRDMTAQVQAEEQLRQSQKLESMGQLTGGVAHDFNNLLTPILGGLDRLQRKGVGDARDQRMIEGALQSAERARTLVQRLLAFARRQPLQPTAVDLRDLIQGMGELVASTTGPQIKVAVEVAPDLPPAVADANQLEMAILNLTLNARDAMPEGGTLRISAVAEQVERGHASGAAPGTYVRLSVADTGTGMDEATRQRAIEPFFSTKGVGRGTGLGLSMVHGLAAQLGGVLTIRSRPGMGTNVELWLPAAAPVPQVEPAVAARAEDDTAAAGTALLVDDEELVRSTAADMLGELGYAVVEAGSAEEALRLLDAGLTPDLVVTDHLMPGLTGTELIRVLAQRRPGLPALLVSGYADVEGVAPDLPRLAKPFRRTDLAASIARVRSR